MPGANGRPPREGREGVGRTSEENKRGDTGTSANAAPLHLIFEYMGYVSSAMVVCRDIKTIIKERGWWWLVNLAAACPTYYFSCVRSCSGWGLVSSMMFSVQC